MDVREKMVEILKQAPFEGKVLDELWWEEKIKRIAEHLISNGVTVQEWISVDERLPEDNNSDVLAYSRIGEESRIYPACYSNGVWFDCVFNAPVTDTTTHWMKMPQPPKEE